MPLYYTEGDERLFDRLNQVVGNIEREKGVTISIHTRVLMFNVVSAIREDPSPKWITDRNDMERRFSEVVGNLQKIIERVVEEEKFDKRLTIFQALHWLSQNIDSICPFKKKW
jgi:hypothetical protein